MHRLAGRMARYFIAGVVTKDLLRRTITNLICLGFGVFLIADLLEIDGAPFPKNIPQLETLEKECGTKRCFSSDFPVVVLTRDSAARRAI